MVLRQVRFRRPLRFPNTFQTCLVLPYFSCQALTATSHNVLKMQVLSLPCELRISEAHETARGCVGRSSTMGQSAPTDLPLTVVPTLRTSFCDPTNDIRCWMFYSATFSGTHKRYTARTALKLSEQF